MTHIVALVGVWFCPRRVFRLLKANSPSGSESWQEALRQGWPLPPSCVGRWVSRTSSALPQPSTDLNSVSKNFGGWRKQIWDQAKMWKWISWQQSKANKTQVSTLPAADTLGRRGPKWGDGTSGEGGGGQLGGCGQREKWQLSGQGFYRSILHRLLGISLTPLPFFPSVWVKKIF